MASLQERKRKNGKSAYIVQFMLDKQRRSVFLDAKYPKRVAKEVSFYVDELAKSTEFGLTPERRVLSWLEELDDDLKQRLRRAGLLSERDFISIADLIKRYFEAESSKLRPSSVVNKKNRRRRIAEVLDFSNSANALTPSEVARLKIELSKTFAQATCTGMLRVLSCVYAWGKTLGIVDKNPFEDVPKGSDVNKSREYYVPMDVYFKVLEHCRDQTERTLWALYRIGGLRRGEAFELRWEDIDWETNRMKVRSPKTENVGKDHRIIPLFQLLKDELEKLRKLTQKPETGRVITSMSPVTIYQIFKRTVSKAGVPVWDRLFQNLRSSRANEIYREFGELKESAWIGHSTSVALGHYLHILDSDYDIASQWKEV